MNVNVGADEHTDGSDDERRAGDALEEVHFERRVRAAALLAHSEHAEHKRRAATDVAAAHDRADAQACERQASCKIEHRVCEYNENDDWSGPHTEGASGVRFYNVVVGLDMAAIDSHRLFVDRHRVRRRLHVHHRQHEYD